MDESTTCAFFAQVVYNGRTYRYKLYALPVIIAVGCRVNSQRATQLRQWVVKVLDTFTRQGYVLDKERLYQSAFNKLVAAAQNVEES